jgi:hypothetical protein
MCVLASGSLRARRTPRVTDHRDRHVRARAEQEHRAAHRGGAPLPHGGAEHVHGHRELRRRRSGKRPPPGPRHEHTAAGLHVLEVQVDEALLERVQFIPNQSGSANASANACITSTLAVSPPVSSTVVRQPSDRASCSTTSTPGASGQRRTPLTSPVSTKT